MTKPMDVDPPPGQEERKIAVHPLAIVNMSDQYTRITTGGSCLERTAAVEGLLFGQEDVVVTGAKPTPHRGGGGTAGATVTTTTRRLQIKDADDIPLQQQEAATIQVSLHQAVFPQHVVVGWYRVAKQRENSASQLQPTTHDLRQTRQLQQHYQEQQRQQQQQPTAATATTQRQQPPPVFVFALLQVPSGGSSGGGSAQSGADSAAGKKEQREDDEEEALPLTLYELQHQQGNRAPVLVAVEDWILDTSASERVAVERVVREQPQHQQQRQQQQQKKNASPQEGGGKGKAAAAAAAATATIPSAYVNHVQQVQVSLHAIQDRLSVLVRFLQDVQRGKISPFPHALVRQVQGLLLQLGPVASLGGDATTTGGAAASRGPTTRRDDDPVLLRQLAVLAKTVDAVQSYAEKFRVVHEASSSSHHHHHRGMGREMRGGRF